MDWEWIFSGTTDRGYPRNCLVRAQWPTFRVFRGPVLLDE